uniref:Uncharacterized protein n=1 Tax=Picea glauca TaxID=3330 RepID=A0A101LY67_PICGL|nr:hypothetical protein ABT39_MTgene5722 [Picea glauca]QHR90654.1 hypothetical protein Q903MT_gene4679 [Picea sitchensis]
MDLALRPQPLSLKFSQPGQLVLYLDLRPELMA